jgi:WhiB family transcriptional regulator, redox-sensing transcriptional regulator
MTMAQTEHYEWMQDGACTDTASNGELWFQPDQEEAAKLICHGCPVRAECLVYAVKTGQWFGVFGGMTPKERGHWAKQVKMPRHGTLTGYTGDHCRCEICKREMMDYTRIRRGAKERAVS